MALLFRAVDGDERLYSPAVRAVVAAQAPPPAPAVPYPTPVYVTVPAPVPAPAPVPPPPLPPSPPPPVADVQQQSAAELALMWTNSTTRESYQIEGDSNRSVLPTYVDPSRDLQWLDAIGFRGDAMADWREVPLVPTEMLGEGDTGGYTLWNPPSDGIAVWTAMGWQYWSTPVWRWERENGLQQQIALDNGVKHIRYVDSQGRRRGAIKSMPLDPAGIATLVIDFAIAAMATFAGGQIIGAAAGAVGGETAGAASTSTTATIAPIEFDPTIFANVADVTSVTDAVVVAESGVSIGDVASAAASVDTTGAPAMWDVFEPFDYSSGEAIAVSTDAAEVDFGWGQSSPDVFTGDAGDFSWIDQYDPGATPTVAVNATPEVTSNVFGTNFDYSFGDLAKDVSSAGKVVVSLAQGAAAIQAATQGRTGVVSGNKTVTPQQARPPTQGTPQSSTDPQRLTAQNKTFFGQLGLGAGTTGLTPIGWLAAILGVGVFAYAVTR